MPKAFSRMPAARVDKPSREYVEFRVFINAKKAWSLESRRYDSQILPRLQDSRLFLKGQSNCEKSWHSGWPREDFPGLSHREHQRRSEERRVGKECRSRW